VVVVRVLARPLPAPRPRVPPSQPSERI
jgi:hypothetical protein